MTFRNSTFKRRVGKQTRKCKACGNLFETWPYRIRDGVRACSMKCAGVLKRNRSVHNCTFCGKEFTRMISQVFHYGAKYCSKDCAHKGYVAECEARPSKDRWGRTSRHADREWQKAIREKDNFTCQRCGTFEKHIHAHHVAPRSRRPDLRLDISNGKCLCNSCHSWVHEHPIEAKALGLLSGESYELARRKVSGESHGMAKLTDDQVTIMRKRFELGESTLVLAEEFSVHRATASRIVHGHTRRR